MARKTTARRVTAKQVAERAGVSPTTVSFVLNEVAGSNISPATRDRVRRAARDLGYAPSAAARTLVSGRSETIGLIISHSEHLVVDAYIPQLLFGINTVARARGFRVLVEAVEDVTHPDAYLELVRAKQIDGLIVLNPRRDDLRLPELVREGFPVATLGEITGAEPYQVKTDANGAARQATAHLIGLGHERIAHISFAPVVYLAADDRLDGYRKALERAGLPFDPTLVAEGNYSAASGAAATRALLARRPDLTAVFCGNDTIAIGALAALHEAGRRVPDDVAIVGFDDIPTAAWLIPALTTVRSPAVASGRRVTELLVDLIEGSPPAERIRLLPSPLIVRRSCGAPPELRTPDPDPDPRGDS